jgi:hypothetical protein
MEVCFVSCPFLTIFHSPLKIQDDCWIFYMREEWLEGKKSDGGLKEQRARRKGWDGEKNIKDKILKNKKYEIKKYITKEKNNKLLAFAYLKQHIKENFLCRNSIGCP